MPSVVRGLHRNVVLTGSISALLVLAALGLPKSTVMEQGFELSAGFHNLFGIQHRPAFQAAQFDSC